MGNIKLVSSDLNGTLVHQHTMSDMIKIYLGEEKFQRANEVFKRQTSGTASIEEAFQVAGPLTAGLTLRQAVDYTLKEMRYIDGFDKFVEVLSQQGIPLVINSTGYSVTIYAMRARLGKDKIHGHIGNHLVFGEGEGQSELEERELEEKVNFYITNPKTRTKVIYDEIKAVGRVELGILDEEAKAELLLEYIVKYFPSIQPNEVMHIGDTMGDSGGIYGIARAGGNGVAFNYNKPLKDYLETKIAAEPQLEERIVFVEPNLEKKHQKADLAKVLPYLK